jgi:hypothetical protein
MITRRAVAPPTPRQRHSRGEHHEPAAPDRRPQQVQRIGGNGHRSPILLGGSMREETERQREQDGGRRGGEESWLAPHLATPYREADRGDAEQEQQQQQANQPQLTIARVGERVSNGHRERRNWRGGLRLCAERCNV